MRSVRTLEQLRVLQGEKPKEPEAPVKPDNTEILASRLEGVSTAMQASTAQSQAALLHGLNMLSGIASKVKEPVEVTVKEPEKIRKWKFTCHYDKYDRLASIIAEDAGGSE